MSLETDARDSLIAAVRQINNVELDPEDFDNVKPSDNSIGAKTGSAWLETLETAVALLRSQKYEAENPSLEKATELRGQVLLESSIYLEILCGGEADNAIAKAAAAAAIAGAVTFAAVKMSARRTSRRKSTRARARRRHS